MLLQRPLSHLAFPPCHLQVSHYKKVAKESEAQVEQVRDYQRLISCWVASCNRPNVDKT